VLRRTICEEVGGIAVETVTEDAHTALKMHRLGYNTAYLALPQAAGLATESLSGHVGQRIRWARGMAQIFRIDNPLFGRGLQWAQRLCYVNAMLHFLYGLPRLIYLTAPLAYLVFGASVIHASAAMIFAYALPHIFHANLTNSRIQGRFRYLFWNEVYEAVLAWYIFRPTLVALINPKLGSFNVTAKGGLIQEEYFDTSIAKASLFLLALNFLGVAAGLWRLTWVDPDNIATVWLNLAWTFYNLVILGACVAAANETRQLRNAHRITLQIPATLYLPDGQALQGQTSDFSTGGLGLDLPADLSLARSLVPAGTASLRDFSYIAPEIPDYIPSNCTGCMDCVTECPDTAILGKVLSEEEWGTKLAALPEGDREMYKAQWSKTKKYYDAGKKKGGVGGMFNIIIDPSKCKG